MEASQNQSANFNSMDPQSIANFLSQISAIQAHVAKNTVNPMQDLASPYFLHPGESPGNNLIPVTLNAHNYNSWSRAMLLALKSKNKLKFIDGSITKPNENDPLFEAWERCNTYIVSWINLSLSPDIAGITREYRREDYTTRFLRGLSEQYSVPRSQLMLMDPLPDIDTAFSMLTQQERQFNESQETKIFLNKITPNFNDDRNKGRGRGRGRSNATGRGRDSRMQCTFCDKPGHTIDTCYKKHGLPPHLRQRQFSSINYMAAEASAEKKSDDLSQCSLIDCQKKANDSSSLDLTPHQREAIIKILKGQEAQLQSQVTPQVQFSSANPQMSQGKTIILKYSSNISSFVTAKSHLWVIDTGATDHVTFNLNDFETYQQVNPIIVRIPNGNQTISNIIGTIRLSNQSYLSNVLFIAEFDFKLISVLKLTNGLKCQMLIDNKICEIQDQITLKRIGVAKCADGLYTMDSQFFNHAAHTNNHFMHNSHHPHLTVAAAVTRNKAPADDAHSHTAAHAAHTNNHFMHNSHHPHLTIAAAVTRNKAPADDAHSHTVAHALCNFSSSTHETRSTAQNTPQLSFHQNFDTNTYTPEHIAYTDHNSQEPHIHAPTLDNNINVHSLHASPTPDTNDQIALRKSSRVKRIPPYLKDYHCKINSTVSTSNAPSRYPISQHISYDTLSPKHKAFSLAVTTNVVPRDYEEAAGHPCWREAIQSELEALDKNQTWRVVKLPHCKRAIGCKWVFRIKFNSDGTIERYKARLVAKGFTQIEGVDFIDTFITVVRMTTLRVVLALTVAKNWHIKQLDVNTAFLHGDLNEEVYMKLPPGLQHPNVDSNSVCKLEKSLYGLRQASRQWNLKLTETLSSAGFNKSESDHSLYTKITAQSVTIIMVYVNGLVLTGNDLNEIESIKRLLDQKFKIKDLGDLKYFLGMEMARSSKGIHLCQRKYAVNILKDHGFLECKPASTPMDYTSASKLSQNSGTALEGKTHYRQLVGRLLYLTNTRLDIAYAIGRLSQFIDCPTDIHMQAAQKVLRYLKGCPSVGLFFAADNDLKITCFSDVDWATCADS
ncbi:uncharacterized protein [Arachis hypogaea]|uniref:uncharacterized protein n=1 Tax=Arachis hypogaea TaxID=3818 RepID=UPI003B20BDAA